MSPRMDLITFIYICLITTSERNGVNQTEQTWNVIFLVTSRGLAPAYAEQKYVTNDLWRGWIDF